MNRRSKQQKRSNNSKENTKYGSHDNDVLQ
jgi:hypothetical protein